MTHIILHGCNGRMGRMIASLCDGETGMKIVAGVDMAGSEPVVSPFFSKLADCDVPADVLIDFSNASAADNVMDYCAARKLPLVMCTTGLDETRIRRLEDLSGEIPVLRSANMSIGVNVLLDILKEAAPKLFAAGFDIEIEEKHHAAKVDAPSGTAYALSEEIEKAVLEKTGKELTRVYDRSDVRKPRDRHEIGISAIRGGTIVGDHDVIFAGTDEVITLSHRAYSRAIFAKGALAAAAYLSGKPAGLYTMRDVLS
ncbi:MAG: 4-hydroxy-tetrahydrodipicolinate reductase [Lachnospiraceae bacterium]|nr:4-hydroxy-tetrahydrodipicolinate reductase [Lachnospiraceae bacterium]